MATVTVMADQRAGKRPPRSYWPVEPEAGADAPDTGAGAAPVAG
jgi:hypothetical protein